MAEGQLLFTLDHEQFMKNWGQSILSFLQEEFDRSKISLSRSLLFSTETENSYWLLVDFENEKAYNIKKENDTMVEISEGPDMEKDPEFLNSTGTILPRLREGISTHTGIIDALKRFNFDEFNMEDFRSSVLSNQKLSFESVYPELQDVCEMLQEILSSSRESLISLPHNDVQHLKNYVIQFYDLSIEIQNYEVESENIWDAHSALLKKITQFRETVKQALLQAASYLSSRTVEQLKDQVKTTLTTAEERVNTVISDGVDKLQKIGEGINEQQTEVLQKSEEKLKEIEQTHLKHLNQLTEIPLSEFKIIFEDQAKKHEQIASYWLWATVGLTVLFSGIFVWLFWWLLKDFGPTEDNISGVLSNLFTKGFFLSLVFLLLNRSIKNYTAEKHLQVTNTHRKNALATFKAFADSAEASDTREQVLLAATKTIFDANQSGYLSTKTGSSDTASPVQHFFKEVISSKSSTDSD